MNDIETLKGLVRQMAEAQTAEELMKIWAKDVTWYDTVNLIFRGEDARKHYTEQFGVLNDLHVDFLELEAEADGNIGFAHSVQHFTAAGVNGGPDIDFIFRQTDCFRRVNGVWEVAHQHVSLPVDMANNTIQWQGKFLY